MKNIWNDNTDINNWRNKAPKVFYHGTSRKKLPSIMKYGLNPNAEKREDWGKGTPRGIYLTPDFENASYFSYDGKVILQVRIPSKDYLEPDPYNTWPLNDELSYESVRYMKMIHPNYIKVVKRSNY